MVQYTESDTLVLYHIAFCYLLYHVILYYSVVYDGSRGAEIHGARG